MDEPAAAASGADEPPHEQADPVSRSDAHPASGSRWLDWVVVTMLSAFVGRSAHVLLLAVTSERPDERAERDTVAIGHVLTAQGCIHARI